jgi:N-ethylmaleimide reductase
MAGVAGPGRVGVKLSPENPHNDIADANPVETFTTAVEGIAALKLAYLHIAALPAWSRDYHALLKPLFHRHAHGGAYLAGGGLTRETAAAMVETGRADGAVFGVLFLCNPDLPERFRQKAALNAPDRDTFYTPGPKGYIDYPLLASP